MPTDRRDAAQFPLEAGSPRWVGYVVTLLLEVALTLGLRAMLPIFPLGNFPIPYILLMMLVAYLFGAGPAILAFLVGLLAFTRYFVSPLDQIWPPAHTPYDWAKLTAFVIGTFIVGFATVLMRRSARRIESLAQELERQRAVLEAFMENVPVGLGLHDRKTRHLIANRSLARISQNAPEQIVGKTVWETLPPRLAAAAADAIERVFATGEPSVWKDYRPDFEEERYFDVEHHPVRTSSGETIGVGVVVVETTQQVKARRELERIYQREHHIAENLQSGLMGAVPERDGCFVFRTYYRAALDEARLGGDFYDVFRINDTQIGIVIGDVSGKGLKAAVQVAMVKYSLRSWAYDCASPSCMLRQVNRTLVRDMDADSFVTVFAGVLDCASRTLLYTSAGHAPVIRWRADEGHAALIEPTGPLLGLATDVTFGEETLDLAPGDEILLGTDGLFELACESGMMDLDTLVELYAGMRKQGSVAPEALVERAMDQCQGKLRDDVAVLIVEVTL